MTVSNDVLKQKWQLEEILRDIQRLTERYQVNVTYPEYILSGRTLDAFNVSISSKIISYIEYFTDAAEQLVLPDGRKSDLAGSHSTFTAVSQFITFKIDLYPCLGGVHPSHDMSTATFDTTANTIIVLSDFFRAGSDYLQVVSHLAEKALFEKYPELAFAFNDPTFRKGFAPEKENFSRWALSDNGLIIFFLEYQVAPYAAGTLFIEIPYTAIMDIIQNI